MSFSIACRRRGRRGKSEVSGRLWRCYILRIDGGRARARCRCGRDLYRGWGCNFERGYRYWRSEAHLRHRWGRYWGAVQLHAKAQFAWSLGILDFGSKRVCLGAGSREVVGVIGTLEGWGFSCVGFSFVATDCISTSASSTVVFPSDCVLDRLVTGRSSSSSSVMTIGRDLVLPWLSGINYLMHRILQKQAWTNLW